MHGFVELEGEVFCTLLDKYERIHKGVEIMGSDSNSET
jgi:hypothetical protein